MNSAPVTLSPAFSGTTIEPGSADYAGASGSILVPGSPSSILRPEGVDDVRAAVHFAAARELPLSVRGGGHAFAGFGTNDGGIVIDLCRLDTIEVIDRESHRVRIGGGATWGQVTDALAPYGLAISSGDTRSVGVGGLTLGGGIGWKVRKHGLALDSLVRAEIITAAGELVIADADQNPELFWAIRGGGGNFGVVTAFEFLAQPTTAVFHGTISFAAEQLAQVLHGWAVAMRTAPEELTSDVEFANPFAGGPQAPVQVQVVFDGDDPELADRAIEPLRRLGEPIADTVALKPYAEVLVEGLTPPPGIRFAARSGFADGDSVSEILDILIATGSSQGSPAISIRSVGGAVSRVAPEATAYAHRAAEIMFATTLAGPPPVIEQAQPAFDALWSDLTPHTSGAYGNFLSGTAAEDVRAIYPERTYQLLLQLKQQYDPGNLFARNHNIRP